MKQKINTGMDKPIGPITGVGRRSYAFTIWLGALIRWTGHFGSRNFDSLYTSQSANKNMFIGYLATIIFVTFIITFIIFYAFQ